MPTTTDQKLTSIPLQLVTRTMDGYPIFTAQHTAPFISTFIAALDGKDEATRSNRELSALKNSLGSVGTIGELLNHVVTDVANVYSARLRDEKPGFFSRNFSNKLSSAAKGLYEQRVAEALNALANSGVEADYCRALAERIQALPTYTSARYVRDEKGDRNTPHQSAFTPAVVAPFLVTGNPTALRPFLADDVDGRLFETVYSWNYNEGTQVMTSAVRTNRIKPKINLNTIIDNTHSAAAAASAASAALTPR